MDGKVSILIPVYNVEEYLDQCLRSVINQTYENIEVIIVNDGSTDNSLSLIQKFVKTDRRLKVINQNNKGVSNARNVALKESTGEFIFYLDPDDYLTENCINDLVEKIKLDNSDMVIFDYSRINDNESNEIIVSLGLNEENIYSGREIAELMLKNLIQGYTWLRLYKRDNLIKHNFRFEERKKVEDFFPVFKETCMTEYISYINSSLYKYRQRVGSLVNSKDKDLMTDFIYAMKLTADYAQNKGFDISLIEEFKLIKSCIVIKNYYMFNKNLDNIYSDFKKNGLDQVFPKISFKLINSSNIKSVFLIVAWRLKLYDKVKRLVNV